MILLTKIEGYLELVHVIVKKILKYVKKKVYKNSQPLEYIHLNLYHQWISRVL